MEITLEAFEQQLEIVRVYKDDKFAGLLKRCHDQVKAALEAQRALDEREKSLLEREKLCEVITASQQTFEEQKSEAEAKNLEDRQHNQRTKDALAVDRKGLDAEKFALEGDKGKIALELTRATAAKTRSENKEAKIEAALQDAEEMKARYAKRLEELGLKAA